MAADKEANFWTKPRRLRLKEAVFHLEGCSPERFADQSWPSGGSTNAYRTLIRRMREDYAAVDLGKGDPHPARPRSPGQSTQILWALYKFIGTSQDRKPEADEKLRTVIFDLRGQYEDNIGPLEDAADSPQRVYAWSRQQGRENAKDAFRLFAAFLDLKPENFGTIKYDLFSKGDLSARPIDETVAQSTPRSAEIHFNCFRYDPEPGYVVKSFIAIRPPQLELEIFGCTFTHVFCSDGMERISRGVVIPTHAGIYLIGAPSDGSGMKLAVLMPPGPKSWEKPIIGLALSGQVEPEPSASRIVLVRTEAVHHKGANIGVFRYEDIADELQGIKLQIRNTIPFALEYNLRNSEGVEIDQETMVAEVREALSAAGLKYETGDGKPFDPVGDANYTFNAALAMWRRPKRGRTPR